MKNMKMALAVCLFAGMVMAGNDVTIVTGGHDLSAMMTNDTANCQIVVSGHVNPKFKGADTTVDLVCMNAHCAATHSCIAQTVGSTAAFCPNTDSTTSTCRPAGTIDDCTGQFTFNIPGNTSTGTCVLPAALSTEVCYFVAHVESTNRQQCNSPTITDANPDPNGSSPCNGGYCNP